MSNIRLKKTWRWFGENDSVQISWLKQLGIEGIVTSLHHIPSGEVWPAEEILKRKKVVEDAGLDWEIVESLPVSEAIKLGNEFRDQHIQNYKQSLKNLSEFGIKTIVYNFMPVLDWIRTDLHYVLPEGGESMLFDFQTFAAFDIYILKRPGSQKDYSPELVLKAKKVFLEMTETESEELAHNIIVKTQGFISGLKYDSIEDYKTAFLSYLEKYKLIGKEELRKNLAFFLGEIIPVAEECGINMAIHPDDPPFPVLGLPRIFSTREDMEWLEKVNPSLRNGITFCTGSFSARRDNKLPEMIKKFSHRIHFAHLRNTEFLEDGSFYESGHLKGWVDMAELVNILLSEMQKRNNEGRKDAQIPMRPDHGIKFFDEFNINAFPGYPFIGRLKGLSEIAGLEEGILKTSNL
ncbi:MAG: mannonate dehydratase [Prolixibacteraceae bacterium]|nr:mannonate dehydratase [Prolixibacteraceae bacterium]MBN2774472.1 mannonate dehydratase [Prolixibacteraceae bacterium]